MQEIFFSGLACLWGLAGGLVLGTAVTAFITITGIVPRIATRLKITDHYCALGTSVLLGITVGSRLSIWMPRITIPSIVLMIVGLASGTFVGCLAVAIAEVLDVLPIMCRRIALKEGISILIIFFALGKLIGALYYFLYPGFIHIS